MALTSSGALSLNEIHVEAGGDTGTTAGLNDTDIRELIDKNSGATMAFNEWYGATAFTARALFVGGNAQQNRNVIDYVEIATTGNATDFGDLLYSGSVGSGSVSSSTRAVHGGGNNVGRDADQLTLLQYSTIATTGNATDFGDFYENNMSQATFSSATRGIWGDDNLNGGGNVDIIHYITIASLGNSLDFGDSTIGRATAAGASSTTRGLVAGGYNSGGVDQNIIEYVTIASVGNATDFGDLTSGRRGPSACSSNTRACFMGGTDYPNVVNTIDYVTIASTGNATDFGDLAAANYNGSATSSSTRGVYAGGQQPQNATGDMVYITIASTGNTSEFGILSATRHSLGASSNAHGGLA